MAINLLLLEVAHIDRVGAEAYYAPGTGPEGLRKSYRVIDRDAAGKGWGLGVLADCPTLAAAAAASRLLTTPEGT